jgi:mono/diheme cytochrome c family protein
MDMCSYLKSLCVVSILTSSLFAQTAVTKNAPVKNAPTKNVSAKNVSTRNVPVAAVEGESWLKHLHKSLDQTNMGTTWLSGPVAPMPGEEPARWQLGLSPDFASQPVTVRGSDLYRLDCQGCHGASGLGAPPEINSVLDPVRATSYAATMERMKKVGMNMTPAEAAKLVKQSQAALLQRLHNGGQNMPPFHYLSEIEIRSLVAYLQQLAGISGAEKKQIAIKESPLRVGEHVVKSTCHICHSAVGPNPSADQLLKTAIPPLSTLTWRTSLPQFVRKVTVGAPIMMGTPPHPYRGRMPVFGYLTQEEAADAYLYLTLYPPHQ